MTSLDLITAYIHSLELRSRKKAISKQTLHTYTQGIKTFVRTVGVQAPVTTETYIAFLKAINFSPSTVRTYKSAVIDYYKFCHSEHGIEIDILALAEATHRYAPKMGELLPNFDQGAIEKLIEHALTLTASLVDLRNRAFIVTAADSGFRAFEICGLTVGSIDWKEKNVVIIGKGNKQALVRLSERSLQCIREYLDARTELETPYPDLSALPLFARHDKSASTHILPVGTGGMWAAIKSVGESAGIDIKKVWPHALRHQFVSQVLRSSGNLKLAQELARHSNIQVTQRYAHLSDQELNDGYEKIFG